MSTISIHYILSPVGQKASLLSGGDGKQEQTATITGDSPLFAAGIAQSEIDSGGNATINLRQWRYSMDPVVFDTVPTMEELLAASPAREAKILAKEEAETNKRREETLAVLIERRTKTAGKCEGMTSYSFAVADWPYYFADDILESADAVAWEAELALAEASAKAKARWDEDFRIAAIAVQQQKIADAEATHRAELGLETGDESYDIEDGELIEVPVWETHNRGKNWMAIITIDPSSPGGLSRSFCEKAKGSSYYILPTLSSGDAIEFGGDYYSGSGKKSAKRYYGFVVRVQTGDGDNTGYTVLRKCADGKSAVKAGKVFAAKKIVNVGESDNG